MERIIRAGLRDLTHFRIPKGTSERTVLKAHRVAEKRDEFLQLNLASVLSAAHIYKVEGEEDTPSQGYRIPKYPVPGESGIFHSAHRFARWTEEYRIPEHNARMKIDEYFTNYRPGKVPSFFLDITLQGEEAFCGRESLLPQVVFASLYVPVYEDILKDGDSSEHLEKQTPLSRKDLSVSAKHQ